jgi:hypothetical protein
VYGLPGIRVHDRRNGRSSWPEDAVAGALTLGAPVLLALMAPAAAATRTAVEVPPALRDIDVPSGCAADYDGWLTAVRA